jgi:protein tyrosine phosphatase (PTP) superfamily phosphohydrolase (DUF442 family)
VTEELPPEPRRRSRVPLIAGIAVFLLGGSWLALNFDYVFPGTPKKLRAVAPDKFYRSEQLSGGLLQQTIKQKQVKSVINLRAYEHERSWHVEELQVCKAAGVEHLDIPLLAKGLPEPEALKRLVQRFEQGPYPMLIHCRSGVDRSGLAAVLYLVIVEGKPLKEAQSTEMPWTNSPDDVESHRVSDSFFALYEKTRKDESLKDWILHKYSGVYSEEMQKASSTSVAKKP